MCFACVVVVRLGSDPCLFSRIPSWPICPLFVAMSSVDRTPYVAGAIPEVTLAQNRHTTETFQLSLASNGSRSFQSIADNMTAFKDDISTFLTEKDFGVGPCGILGLTGMANSWDQYRTYLCDGSTLKEQSRCAFIHIHPLHSKHTPQFSGY